MTPTARQRARKACFNCRKRKVKCDFDDVAYPSPPCGRCKKAGLSCEISSTENRGGFHNVLKGKIKKKQRSDSQTTPSRAVGALRQDLYTANDALAIMNQASQGSENNENKAVGTHSSTGDVGSEHPCDEVRGHTYGRISIDQSPIVTDGIISAAEATVFVELFFTELASFYAPFIPEEYNDLGILAACPTVLAVICTIGAKLKGDTSYDVTHRKLWLYLQQTLNHKLWNWRNDEAKPIIFSIIILADWIPNALFLPEESQSRQEAIEKHFRICWPLMGQALRLAQFTGILEYDVETFIALHFADHLNAARMGLQPMKFEANSDKNGYIENMMQTRCTIGQKARLDCAKLLQMTNSSLYPSRESTRLLISSGRYLAALRFLYPLTEKWKRDYVEIVKSNAWRDRSIMFEFYYCQLYIFSIALVPWQDEDSEDKLIAFDDMRKYLDIALDAAKNIIEFEASDIPLNLRFAPITWILRLLHASLFLAKSLLVRTVHCKLSEQRSVVKLIQVAGSTMKKLLPLGHENYFNVLQAITSHFSENSYSENPGRNLQKDSHNNTTQSASQLPQFAEYDGVAHDELAVAPDELSEDAIFELLNDAQALVGFGESLPSMTTPLGMSPVSNMDSNIDIS